MRANKRGSTSLPDLVADAGRPQSATSLTEGFPGLGRKAALAPPSAFISSPGSFGTGSSVGKVLPLYYRARQLAKEHEGAGFRSPKVQAAQLRLLEQEVAVALRPLNAQLFQRFDEQQLERALRMMPLVRLRQWRWVIGGDDDPPTTWPSAGVPACVLLMGCVALFDDVVPSRDMQPRKTISPGTVFCNQPFQLGSELVKTEVAMSARCWEPSIIGVLSDEVLQIAFFDRGVLNKRLAQVVKKLPSLKKVFKDDSGKANLDSEDNGKKLSTTQNHHEQLQESGLRDLVKLGSIVHVDYGHELLLDERLGETSFLAVTKGAFEVRADLELVERLDSIPPKKIRIRVLIEKGERLAGDSILDKLDPYCIVKLGDFKRFQTPILMDVGSNPVWQHTGVLRYDNESTLDFTCFDYDKWSADDLVGNGSLDLTNLHDGWRGKIKLTQPKRGIFKADSTMEVPAGTLYVSVHFDFEPPSTKTVAQKQRSFPDVMLYRLCEGDTWGEEDIMLDGSFRRTLETAAEGTKYNLRIGRDGDPRPFRLICGSETNSTEGGSCVKVTRRSFLKFIHQCSRQRPLMVACKTSVLQKKRLVRERLNLLIQQWMREEASRKLRGGYAEDPDADYVDPSLFRVSHRGQYAQIVVRNAMNLSGGGLFDKLDPYAILRFRGSKEELRTPVLQDAGGDPIWDFEGAMLYRGETALDITVWDEDRNADDLIGTGVLQLEQFCCGFEGMVELAKPKKPRKQETKEQLIVISISWEPLPD